MRAILAEAGKIDEKYLGPDWIMISNDILNNNLKDRPADHVANLLRQRIGLKELNRWMIEDF